MWRRLALGALCLGVKAGHVGICGKPYRSEEQRHACEKGRSTAVFFDPYKRNEPFLWQFDEWLT